MLTLHHVNAVLVIAFCVAIYFYQDLLTLVQHPYTQAQQTLHAHGYKTEMVVANATGGLLLQMKLCGVVAVIASAPYWLYQLWAFILPGLHPNEKRYSRMFACVAGPLFLAGVALGYYVLPKGLEVLISFVPKDTLNLVDFTTYFSFLMRMLLIFGIAMEIPLFVVLLNLAGVVSGQALGKYRGWIIIGTMVFAAGNARPPLHPGARPSVTESNWRWLEARIRRTGRDGIPGIPGSSV